MKLKSGSHFLLRQQLAALMAGAEAESRQLSGQPLE
jgi:hypothetical protein